MSVRLVLELVSFTLSSISKQLLNSNALLLLEEELSAS